ILEVDIAEHAAKLATSFMNEDQLIGIRIFIKIFCLALLWGGQGNNNVLVKKYGFSTLENIFFWADLKSLQQSGLHVFFHTRFGLEVNFTQNFLHHSGSVVMVEQGGHAIKTYGAKKLLIINGAILFFEGGMSFMRDLTQLVIKRHILKFFLW